MFRALVFCCVLLAVTSCGDEGPGPVALGLNFRVNFQSRASYPLQGDSAFWLFQASTFSNFTEKRALRMELRAASASDSLHPPISFFFDGGGAPFGGAELQTGTFPVKGAGPDPVVYTYALTTDWYAIAMTGTVTLDQVNGDTVKGHLSIGMDRYRGSAKIDSIHVTGTFVAPHSSLPEFPL